jgi:uncharacterized damage-inducible protein DinB
MGDFRERQSDMNGENVMTIAETMLAEFDHEVQTTRRFLERLPDGKLTWKPHEKSMSAGQLALHIAAIPGQVIQLSMHDEAAPPDFNTPNPQPKTVQEVLDVLDQSIATVRKVLPTIPDDRMHEIWRLKKNGKELTSMPRVTFLRNILFNQGYHHRGQFGVYLRLEGAKVPHSYGPSGDETPDFLQGQ